MTFFWGIAEVRALRYDGRALFGRFCGDGWVLVGPAAFKAVVRRAERLGCVRFARISATDYQLPRVMTRGSFTIRSVRAYLPRGA